MVDEQTDEVRFDGDVFAFTLSTQYARKVYRYADELRAAGKKVIIGGIHVIMLGLPHDTPERLARTLRYLKEVPCGLYDLRSLRLYPSTSLYREMLSRGEVTENWWLAEDQGAGNHLLPGCLGVHYRHDHFAPMQLQHWTLRFSSELGRMTCGAVANVLRVAR